MQSEAPRFLEFDRFRFDVRNRQLTREGRLVPLTPKAADVLLVLLNGGGDIVSKEVLLKSVWTDTVVEEGNLAFHVHAIREALRDGGNGRQFVENVPRRGYRFAADIRHVAPGANGGAADAEPSRHDAGAIRDSERDDRRHAANHVLVVSAASALVVLVGTAAAALAGSGAFRSLRQEHLAIARYDLVTSDGRSKEVEGPLLVDASFVYFREGAHETSMTVPVAGGETRAIDPQWRDFRILDVHPATHAFLMVRRNESGVMNQLWTSTAAGPARVGTIACAAAAWSPDGRQIVFTTDTTLAITSIDGSTTRRIAVVDGFPGWPRWSPDGRVVRFTVTRTVDRVPGETLWEVGSDGRNLRPLPIGSASSSECCGSWTPDGHFVYASRHDTGTDLWTLDEAADLLGRTAMKAERLTAGPISFSSPGISVDGSHVFAVGLQDHGELVRYDAGLRTFVPYLRGISAIWTDFSRDGRSVVYVRHPEGTLWRANADGSEKRQLTVPPMKVDGCFWSPDGSWIAFRGSFPGRPFKIYLLRTDGGNPRPIIEEDRDQGVPSWSPDGTRLVFGGVPIRYGAAAGESIQIYDLTSRSFSVVPGGSNLWTPRWSPDGRYIAAVTITDRALRLFDVAKKTWTAIPATHIDNPTWSRDSRFLYYNTEGGVRSLRRARIADRSVDEVADLEGFPLQAYWWSGLSPDDAPLVLRSAGGQEIYALTLDRRR